MLLIIQLSLSFTQLIQVSNHLAQHIITELYQSLIKV